MTIHEDVASDMPTLSIVIPAYNVADYVGQAVGSALDQTRSDIETIVVDDGSTDATSSVVAELVDCRRDRRLRVVRQANRGLSAARNTGIRCARGHYIGFLDGDDAWRPEKAERQLALMEANPAIGISFSYSEYMLENGVPTGRILRAEVSRPTLADMVRRNHVGNGSSPIVRKECFDQAGLFREGLRSCEDYEMWCRILHRTDFRAALVPGALTLYRLREASLCFAFDQFLENADLAVDLLQEEIPELPSRLFDAAHAEHYRITAWKALSAGETAAAQRYLARAFRLHPWLFVSDRRALGTLAAIAIRKTGSESLQRSFERLLASRSRPEESRPTMQRR
jgi:glycosyltransferase involved in cell wall biosynthesis